jgi:hypothetical protein
MKYKHRLKKQMKRWTCPFLALFERKCPERNKRDSEMFLFQHHH